MTLDQDALATRLALALKRLKARLREESQAKISGLSLSQLSILQRLRCIGSTTASELAMAEHVSQQAIAQIVSHLKSAGFLDTKPDTSDGRKTLISLTDTARDLHASMVASRNAWLFRAIDLTFDPDERAALETAIDLLERLADAEC